MDTHERPNHDLANPACLSRLFLLECGSSADAVQCRSGRRLSALWALSMKGFSSRKSMSSSCAIKSLGLGIYFPSDIYYPKVMPSWTFLYIFTFVRGILPCRVEKSNLALQSANIIRDNGGWSFNLVDSVAVPMSSKALKWTTADLLSL